MHEEFKNIVFEECFTEDSISRLRSLRNSLLPKKLYKYRPPNEYTMDSILSGNIWLASSNTLNDPYDCFISLDVEKELNKIPKEVLALLSDSEIHEIGNEISNGQMALDAFFLVFSKRDNFSKKSEAEKLAIKQNIFGTINNSISSLENQIKNVRESLGICSFAQEYHSILMWSHYAQSHQGVCFEYDVNFFDDHVKNCLYPVCYEDQLFDFTKIVDEFSKYPLRTHLLISLIKSKDWSYEREWRIVNPFLRNKCINVSKPTCVYLGAYIKNEFEKEIKDLCKFENIKVLKMKNEKTKFSLVAEEIN